MDLSKLIKTTQKTKKRVGRGISAGQGKTSGRGTKGQKSRTGKKIRPGFEGGQMPLAQRVPKKRGFVARKAKPQTITLSMLENLKDGDKVTMETLIAAKLIKKNTPSVKVVSTGSLTKKITVSVPTTKNAAVAIEKAGGKIIK
jgi:large subunit ribosomal protein L15